ncbi:signal recognition particle receptor alpha subunit, putative [Entamoeba invadens IP1]|uniref:Signal recognition particle receptor alpha subunit, putative n=1 Tax=Entamoeba invadens IP1 TaxID=370355 RepID=A0A0A1TXI5_ENTIV|nr:signal recognition particle receptor alpha subunit, putative [Entamoeba invadens IP1]ELP84230.1 signal recognition particle receptor alpha subunit, putative [Entamoeba invadens IP1]|eukprot:XP_004183576.1 signal recognition particle receptor alpha subunit, putative [Entamoeba invadens IP1]
MEEICVVTTGGIVLYSKKYSEVRGEPVNTMIKEYILADRSGECKANIENYQVHWVTNVETSTLFIAVHMKTIKVDYCERMLSDIEAKYRDEYLPSKHILKERIEAIVVNSLKESQEWSRQEKQNKKMRTFAETEKGVEIAQKLKKEKNEKSDKHEEKVVTSEGDGTKYTFAEMSKKDLRAKPQENQLQKWISGFKGTRVVDEGEATQQAENMEKLLIEKNVNSEVASQIKSNIHTLLLGKKVDTFTLRGTVIQGVTEVLTRIMTPSNVIDVAKEIEEKKSKGEVFTMVFIGVNGVGKSTSLSKMACWLTSLNYKVMIAACDTFRAGAVDQLAVHAQRLGIPLYEKGYDTDPSAIARNALKRAKEDGYDVLLVDTAGRMQGNDALMKAIAKLVHSAQTDLVLFVAEALVGNDAVNQLTTFNRYVIDYAPVKTTKGVSGIILTKFDTIDDKVGAAISLTYCTGIPILFVGTGQHYTDLKLLNVQDLIDSLLK